MNTNRPRMRINIEMKLERISPGILGIIDARAEHISTASASSSRPHRHHKSWSTALSAGLAHLFMRASVLVKNGIWLKHVNDNRLVQNNSFFENPYRVAILITLHELEQRNKPVRLTADEKNELNKCIADDEPDRSFYLDILHHSYERAQKATSKSGLKSARKRL